MYFGITKCPPRVRIERNKNTLPLQVSRLKLFLELNKPWIRNPLTRFTRNLVEVESTTIGIGKLMNLTLVGTEESEFRV